MRRGFVLILVVSLIVAAAGRVRAQSEFPDPAKWNREGFIRVFEENAGTLLSGIYRLGGFNGGASGFSTFNDMLLTNPNSVQSMEATVTLLDASAVGSITTFPRASLEGFFYWNGGGTGTSTDQTGHVNAAIALALNTTTGQPEARYFVVRCNEPACSTTTAIVNAAIMPVSFFESHRLSVSYDGANFSFQVDGGSPIVVAAPDVTRLPPTNQFKALRTRTLVPAFPTAAASVLALFENVAVNGAPYDAFDGKTLPRVQILPGAGTFSSQQTFDVVLMVETAGEPVANVRLTVNGADFSSFLPLAIQGTLPSGGVTYRFPDVPAAVLGVGTPALLGVEATTASGKTARGFALWKAIAATE